MPRSSTFQKIQDTAFLKVQNVMGEYCTWTPAAGGSEQSAKVLFQNPTEEMKVAGVPYDPEAWIMEYNSNQLVGLFDLIREKSGQQVVNIAGQEFYCGDAVKKFDGNTIVVALLPKSD